MEQIEALLIEAGRVLSSANEAALRQCVTALQKVLDQLGGTDTAAKESAIAEAWLVLDEATYDMGTRMAMAKQGQAMDDGSFPIATVADLKAAIQAFGRAADKAKAKAHIIKRAKALKATDQLPADWVGSTNREAALAELELAGDLVPLTEKAVPLDLSEFTPLMEVA